MKNIDRKKIFKSTIVNTKFGILTTLTLDTGISAKDSIWSYNKSLLANYVYDENGNYQLVYTIVDTDGNEESFVEDDGILPTLFLSPQQTNYVSIIPYNPDKELEISIPIFNRENTELSKGNRPFLGNFIGTTEHYSLFYDVDIWSDSKPDKMLAIEFKNGVIKKKHNKKISLPRNNKPFISDNEIHLLATDNSGWLHRQIDEKGNIIRERVINPTQKYFNEILNLSFEKESYILCEKKGKISVEAISCSGQCSNKPLIDIKDMLYNTWKPEQIAANTYTIRFNTEFGNGWFTIKNDELLEFFYSKDVKGYKNLLTDEVIQMENEDLIISSINKTAEGAYSVVFYSNTKHPIKNKKLVILNRKIS